MTDDLSLAGDFPPVEEAQWRALVDKALKGARFEDALVSRTLDGLAIEPLYTRADEAPAPAPRAVFVKRPWDIRQICAEPDPALANAAMREDMAGGATSLTLRLAAPEQAGIAIASNDDLSLALKEIALESVGVWLEPGVDYASRALALEAVWQERDVSPDQAVGGFGADPLGSLAGAGGLPVSLEQAMGEAVGLVTRVRDAWPSVAALLADGRPYHDGGASEAQELACLCATAVAYLRACDAQGVEPSAALPRIAFALAADADLFLTLAKLRAARALIARIAEASGVTEHAPVHLHVSTSQRMMARRDPHSNMLRTTIACAGAALGGADAITVLPFTWPLGRPDGFARRMARNIQLVLREESMLGHVADPAGGSWHVERLTRDLAARAWSLFRDIEARGGMSAALAEGLVQAWLRETAEARAARLATGEEMLIGVSMFVHLAESPLQVEPWPLPDELDPAITVEPVPPRRPAEPFERLRDASDAHLARHGERPKVFLANLGQPADFGARATHAARMFAAGGIAAIHTEGFDGADAAARAFTDSGARIACLCGGDAAYAALAADAAQALAAAGAAHVYLAGAARPALKSAGVGTFLSEGRDMLAVLRDAHDLLGVRHER